MTLLQARPIQILLVEDNPGDLELMLEALEESKMMINLTLAKDGEEAMAVLYRQEGHEQDPVPDIVLLDLNLPKKDGREVLAEIKADEKLHRIPVVILTTSAAESDILRAYELNANCYITKPVGLQQFLEVVNSIKSFWLTVVKLPRVE